MEDGDIWVNLKVMGLGSVTVYLVFESAGKG